MGDAIEAVGNRLSAVCEREREEKRDNTSLLVSNLRRLA